MDGQISTLRFERLFIKPAFRYFNFTAVSFSTITVRTCCTGQHIVLEEVLSVGDIVAAWVMSYKFTQTKKKNGERKSALILCDGGLNKFMQIETDNCRAFMKGLFLWSFWRGYVTVYLVWLSSLWYLVYSIIIDSRD